MQTKRIPPWRIVFSMPEFQPLHEVVTGQLTQQAYIQQGHIAHGLQLRGHQITFFGPSNSGTIICTRNTRSPHPASMTWSHSKVFDFAAKASWRIQRWLGIPYLNVFSNLRIYDAAVQCLPNHDVVFERHSLYRTGIASACRRLQVPYVLFFDADEIYEHDYLGNPIQGILRTRAQKTTSHCLRLAQHVVCPSTVIRKQLMQNWKVEVGKISVLPNAVDTDRHRPFPESLRPIRASLGLDTDAPVLIFVGRFYRWHDIDTLLHALRLLNNAYPEVKLIMVGDGNRYEEVQQSVINMDLADKIIFTGRVANDRIPHFIGAADIAVAPYPQTQDDFWGSPMKLFEYMSCGIAVVASDAGQIGEIIEDGVNGMLVPSGDAEALAKTLARLITDKNLRARLAQRARKDAVDKHDWKRYVDHLEGVFSKAMDSTIRRNEGI